MKGNVPYEIFLLLNKNFKPKDLIRIGYSRATVYRYNSKWHEVKRKFEQAKRKLNDLKHEQELKA
jgi:hypothetical protein